MRDRRLRQFLNETRSATAVEFAMIGTVLFFFLFSVFMLGIGQFWQLVLDDSVRNATRQFCIDAAGKNGVPGAEANFVTNICNEFGSTMPNCAANIQYVVQGGPAFTTAGGATGITPATVSSTGILSGSKLFSSTIATAQPLLVQVAYKLPINIPLVPGSLITLNGTPALISTVAMVTEN